MPLQLKSPIIEEIPLTDADPTGETTVTIKQATMSANTLRADLWATASRIMRDRTGEELELKQRISTPEVMRKEVWLTLIGCNILGTDTRPLFRFRKDATGADVLAMNENQFNDAWGQLPGLVAFEIHQAVLKVNADWAPANPGVTAS